MDCLVVGANGLLGSNAVSAGQSRDLDIGGTYHSTEPGFDVPLVQFDLEKAGSFGELLDRFDPDAVVNCAAMTDVDACESHPDLADEINGEAPGTMAEQCAERSVEFLHVSTDYVFDGTARSPYAESAKTDPAQAYGESKLAGECEVQSRGDDAVIVRLSFVWGAHRSSGDLTGFPAWVRDQLRAEESVPLFTDQWVTPTRAGQAAETILDLLGQDGGGLFHVAAKSCVTPFEFGELLADALGADRSLLQKGSMADVDRTATRPSYTCLDVSKVESELGRAQPTLREDIETVIEDL